MSVRVTPRARLRDDRSGDPLDGLVNLFDLGLVLALAFLLVALSSLQVRGRQEQTVDQRGRIVVGPREQVRRLPAREGRAIGRGERVGSVYRLEDGRLVYVAPRDAGR